MIDLKELPVRNAVRTLREKRGLTQKELAAEVEVTRQTIGLIEANRYNPTIALCLGLAEILDTDLDTLFWVEEE